MNNLSVILTAVCLAGCASHPSDIPAAYVSPVQYQNYNCDQISDELQMVGRRVSELQGTLDEEASADSAQMAVGLVIFWPALFFLEGGDGPEAQEYARLRGERDALEQVAIQKSCGLSVMDARLPGPPPEPSQPGLDQLTADGSAPITQGPKVRALQVLREGYADCTIDALLSYDETQFTSQALARKAHSDCTSEFDVWRDAVVDIGADRTLASQAFARAKNNYVDELATYVDEFRADGISLARMRG